MEFPGFDAEDFEVFSIPDFAGRMGAIRARVRPKLAALGEDLTERIAGISGLPTFPHVAQHMRRRVNPPDETWVAFGRDRKGYKRWTHYRIAVSGTGVRVTVFVEDDADDKPQFGQNLESGARELLIALGAGSPVVWYTLDEGPLPQNAVGPEHLRDLGRRLQTTKTLKFQAGIPLERMEAVSLGPDAFEQWAVQQFEVLKPLYLAGVQPGA